MTTLDRDSKIAVSKAVQLVDIFRAMDSEMPIGALYSFLMIAQEETDTGGLMITDLKDRLGLEGSGLSTLSRYTQTLAVKPESMLRRNPKPGLELITRPVSGEDTRRKTLKLTPKGRRLINQIKTILGGI